jgi:hypothetical protein
MARVIFVKIEDINAYHNQKIRINLKDVAKGAVYRPWLADEYRLSYDDIQRLTPIGHWFYARNLFFLASLAALAQLCILGIQLSQLQVLDAQFFGINDEEPEDVCCN